MPLARDTDLDVINDHLLRSMALDHVQLSEINLVQRWTPVGLWFHERGNLVADPYQKVVSGHILPEISGRLRDGTKISGVNFASQDYLSLSSHSKIIASAKSAMEHYGVHSAGSSALMGNSSLSLLLEQRLEGFLGYKECTLFPTGWAAGFGIIKLLARSGDHIVIDVLAHACLQEGADSSEVKVHRFPHLSNEAVERRLMRIRETNPNSGILVVTETLFSMDSDSPDIRILQHICRDYRATLLDDCAHDLGCMGIHGRGVLEQQEMMGKVDVLVGTFSKAFASIGGFVATQYEGFRTAIRACCGPQTFTNAMTPLQAAIIHEALEIVDSDEGAERRLRLQENTLYLRSALQDKNFEILGQPSAIVPVIVGDSRNARLMTHYALSNGVFVNLVEAPAVAKNRSRWRLQVMADHQEKHSDALIKTAVEAHSSLA